MYLVAKKWPSPLDISIHPTYLLSSRLMLRTLESGLLSSSTGLGGAAAGLPGGSSRKPGLVEVKQVRLMLRLILMLIMMLWFDVDVDVDFDVDVDRRIVCNNQVSVSWLCSLPVLHKHHLVQ